MDDKHQISKLVRTTERSPYGWINHNVQKLNVLNCFGHLLFVIWKLFVICYLLFGALIPNLSDFIDTI